MKLETGWVPVALSSTIEAGTSTGALVEGAEIVIWRDSSGHAHVWEDRCPHRGMRMSFGFVRGDHIACLYHGWQYDSAGQCRHIPAHPELDVPSTIKVPTYSTEERYGIIWATSAPDAPIPALPTFSEMTSLRSMHIDCPLQHVMEALGETGFTAFAGNAGQSTVHGMPLLIALQAANAGHTVLHIVVLSEADASMLKRLARWAEDLRFSLESPVLAEAI